MAITLKMFLLTAADSAGASLWYSSSARTFYRLCFLSLGVLTVVFCGGNDGTGPTQLSSTVLLSAEAPDTLYSGVGPTPFAVTAQDSNGLEKVVRVVFRLRRENDVLREGRMKLQETVTVDRGEYVVLQDSTFAAGLVGDYLLEFQAIDEENRGSNVLTRNIHLQNAAPVLLSVSNPDTMQREADVFVQVFLQVSDPQGYADIDSVYFKLQKPDGSFGGESEQAGGFSFLLFDDGNNNVGDDEAEDGDFAYRFPITRDAQLGDYSFFYYARDRIGNLVRLERAFVLVPLDG